MNSVVTYEQTDKLKAELPSRILAQCHIDTWVGFQTIHKVIFKLEDLTNPVLSPARRQVIRWALDRDFLRAVTPGKVPANSAATMIAAAVEARLGGGK